MDKQITGFYTVKDENNVIKQSGKCLFSNLKLNTMGRKQNGLMIVNY